VHGRFGYGNTRLVIGEGKEKKVIINEDEKFDDSMIPLKKFSGKFSTFYLCPLSQNTRLEFYHQMRNVIWYRPGILQVHLDYRC